MGLIRELWDIVKSAFRIKSVQDHKTWDELLQSRIRFLKQELEDSTVRISALQRENPTNREDYVTWQRQITELYGRLDDLTLQLYQEKKKNLEKDGIIIFYEKMVQSLEKKCEELIRSQRQAS